MKISDVFSINGRLKRFEYAAIGFLLVAIKYNLDRIVAYTGYEKIFYPADYVYFFQDPSIILEDPQFAYVLALTSIPFIAIGTILTIKRLRDANLPKWMVAFFFLPLLNIIFFALLCLLPSSVNNSTNSEQHKRKWLDRFIPQSGNGSAALSIVFTSALSAIAAWICINVFDSYGGALFLGVPFVQGMSAALIHGYHKPRTLRQSLSVAWLSMAMVAFLFLVLAIEGVVCIAMAAPLWLGLVLIGAIVGNAIQDRKINTSSAIVLIFAMIPMLSGVEYSVSREPALRNVTTEILINSPREKVWDQLVTFNEMEEPNELLFKSGIAYPVRAEIEGMGVGSIRKCWFTTGAFIEPIEIWDQPNLLKFSVTEVPPPLVELSFYNDLHLPHLEGYFTSEKGQFKLISISKNKTLLQGTTWYRHKIWPGFYWRLWSDYILHKIHYRVLNHIKNQTEKI